MTQTQLQFYPRQTLYTASQAAKRLRLSDGSVIRHYIASGLCQARKLGRDWVLTDIEVERLSNTARCIKRLASLKHEAEWL